jgi:hypothetical protein
LRARRCNVQRDQANRDDQSRKRRAHVRLPRTTGRKIRQDQRCILAGRKLLGERLQL